MRSGSHCRRRVRTRAGAEELRTHDAGLVVDVALDQLFDVLQRLHLKHHHRPDHLLRRICARDRLGRQQRRAVLCRVCLRVSQRVERAKQNRMRTYSAIRSRAAALRWRGAVVMCVSATYCAWARAACSPGCGRRDGAGRRLRRSCLGRRRGTAGVSKLWTTWRG